MAAIEASFPVPILCVPLREAEPIGAAAIGELGAALFRDVAPADRLGGTRPIEVFRRGRRPVLAIALPGTSKEEVEVAATGRELLLRVRDAQRRIALPDSLIGRPVEESRLRRGRLEVVFGA